VEDYEKLGLFYLGRAVSNAGEVTDEPVLYDAKDLTTHAVIIGMTGSGKTGLGIAMLEEAGMDRVPVIAVDPKGDLGNLMLTFPELDAQHLVPWVSAREASRSGRSVEEYAADQAATWAAGLRDWGQTEERIRRLRETVSLAIYTPGSSAGLPISVLQSFHCPPEQVRNDKDLYREKIAATATSVLALMGIAADPITSREHILVSNILEHRWDAGEGLDIAGLIGLIQAPPFERIGVMDLDGFYPPKERFALAMQLNNLLASPGFEAWLEGEPLSAASLLYTPEGKPRVSILSIAHLSDSERMFFVTMLLNEVLSWMRTQSGTGSLRAILYMDEIFGYLPPTANPPSKPLLLTLLKQARAYGLGLVLATQNPVDLDYKGLSNTGTWLIGRLQTERDKQRLMDGLAGASGSAGLDRRDLERILAGLGKRRFLLHNVHAGGPVVFATRWVMSYLAGPLTRTQIKRLMKEQKAQAAEAKPGPDRTGASRPGPAAPLAGRSVPPPDVQEYFLRPLRPLPEQPAPTYRPVALGLADVAYHNARYHVDTRRRLLAAADIDDGPVPVDWHLAEALDPSLDLLQDEPLAGAGFDPLPEPASNARNYAKWERLLKRWIRAEQALTVYRSPTFKLTSEAHESEGEFRARLQNLARERRDAKVEALRKRYAGRIGTLEERLRRARQRLEQEEAQAQQGVIDTAISFGTAILGAFLGRKAVTAANARRLGSAARKAGHARKERGDVERAQAALEAAQAQLEALHGALEAEVARLDEGFDSQREELREVPIKPKLVDIHIHFVGLGWAPW
jgi:hypothetical protein